MQPVAAALQAPTNHVHITFIARICPSICVASSCSSSSWSHAGYVQAYPAAVNAGNACGSPVLCDGHHQGGWYVVVGHMCKLA
jgi:hypothetical protein